MRGHILVVDDDADLRETVQMLLEEGGYLVTVAANGRAALEQVRAARPSLILLDLMMPEMNGWQFLDHASRDASLCTIPIVIMTAHKSAELPTVAPEDLLHKPFDATKLFSTIARHVR
jgi:CheY-like chemotaxis protein